MRAPLLGVLHRVQRARIKTVGERIIDQPARHPQHFRAMQRFDPVALQCAQVVDVSELVPQFFKNVPVAVARGGPVCLCQMFLQIGLHAVVVDERVVDVEQEDNTGRSGHCILICSRTCWARMSKSGNGWTNFQLFLPLPSSSLAISVTRSGSNPNFRCSSFSGADAPNVFMPMTRPDLPT